MDFATKFLALCNKFNMSKVKRLFVSGCKCQLLVAKTVSTIGANSLLKQCDAALGKLKDNISFEFAMEIGNAPPL